MNYTTQFRVLALSATPGADGQSIQQVIDNLLIAHMEVRTEDALDVRPYIHGRQVRCRPLLSHSQGGRGSPAPSVYCSARLAPQMEKLVVPMGDDLSSVRDQFKQLMVPCMQRLQRAGVLQVSDPDKISPFLVVRQREYFAAWPDARKQFIDVGAIYNDLAMLHSLSHAYMMLHYHGLGPFFAHLKTLRDDETEMRNSRAKQELLHRSEFQTLMRELEQRVRVAEAAQFGEVYRASLT